MQTITIEVRMSDEVLDKFVTHYPNSSEMAKEVIRQLAEHPDKVAAGEAVWIKYKPFRNKRERGKIMRKTKDKPLADLNEVGRVCKNVGMDYAECDQFVCSNCGIELQDWNRVERCEDGEVIYHEYTFRYCPNCGVKIVYV